MEEMETFNNMKDFSASVGEILRNNLGEIISNDEFAGKSALVNNETIFENQMCMIPFIVRNSEANFDMFSYTIILTFQQKNEIYVSVKYKNQNISDVTDFGLINGNIKKNEILEQIYKDFKKRFNSSKGDFNKLSR
jgi:hypothetical protein